MLYTINVELWEQQDTLNIIMWIWILIIFAVGGAILGALSDDKDGAMGGCLAGLFTGGGCLVEILIAGLSIFFIIWLFGALFG